MPSHGWGSRSNLLAENSDTWTEPSVLPILIFLHIDFSRSLYVPVCIYSSFYLQGTRIRSDNLLSSYVITVTFIYITGSLLDEMNILRDERVPRDKSEAFTLTIRTYVRTCFNIRVHGCTISSGHFSRLDSFCDTACHCRGRIFCYVTIALDFWLIDAVSKMTRFKGIGRLSWRWCNEIDFPQAWTAASSFACKVPFALQLDNTNGNYSWLTRLVFIRTN